MLSLLHPSKNINKNICLINHCISVHSACINVIWSLISLHLCVLMMLLNCSKIKECIGGQTNCIL